MVIRKAVLGMPGLPPQLGRPTGDAGRIAVQNQHPDGKLTEYLSAALRGIVKRENIVFSQIPYEVKVG
jgi:hypothetical protein